MEQPQDLAALLTDDLLEDVLRRLAPRSLAASRCVCKAWRATIDDRRMLRPDLLPLSLGGIFISFNNHGFSEFFSRPSTGPTISGKMDHLPGIKERWRSFVEDHCNGLLLLSDFVVNPATRWWAPLPTRPPSLMSVTTLYYDEYLVFDPTISMHYEVLGIPRVRPGATEESEWPPSPCILWAFSSRTGRWEERAFVREGEAAGTVADMLLGWVGWEQRYAAYWRGALYVHSQADFVMRISLSNNTYRVIKPPLGIQVNSYPTHYLGKSEKGVYFASIDYASLDYFRLQVWILDESYGQMKWLLKHHCDLRSVLPHRNYDLEEYGPWILEDINYDLLGYISPNHKKEAPVQGKFEWNSDSDDVLDNEDRAEERYSGYFSILGFHPYKEVVFLSLSLRRGLAYHLNTSKVQDLGNMYPTCHIEEFSGVNELIEASFPYTPCWM